jgi:protein-S-isoprenylcysteine O-methyltransferase Ste14
MIKDSGKYFGSTMMFGFGLLALYRWQQTHLIYFLLLVLRDFVAGYFFLKRENAQAHSGKTVSILAYISAAIPLFYFGPDQSSNEILLVSNILAITGFLFVALATIELGTSIGISPAKRSMVKSGIYSWVKHPMYMGYVLSELGMSFINMNNAAIFIISIMLYYFRAKIENNFLKTSYFH